MIRVGRPWNLLLLLVGPGPISLMHSARSNKSSEGDTTVYCTAKFCKKNINEKKDKISIALHVLS
jgi:hypothetical protein